MVNEKRLIDANALTDVVEHIDWYHISLQGTLAKGANSQLHTPLYKADDIYKTLKEAPTVDAVEVVRCKACTYWDKAVVNKKGFLICPASGMEIQADDFCSYGERRTDG